MAIDPSIKKIINNGVFIAELAPLLRSIEAHHLAEAAGVYHDILSGFGIKPSLEGFDGCEQAQLIIKWVRDDAAPDAKLMREWTDAIWSAIDDLAHGKVPRQS